MGVKWRDSLEIGVEEIDRQHKELVHQFGRLQDACRIGQGIDELRNTLIFLEEYVHTHFNDEEALQRLRGFPGYEGHRAQHIYFLDQIKLLREEVDREGFLIHNVLETNNLLLKWLLNHISKVDTVLGKYLNSGSQP